MVPAPRSLASSKSDFSVDFIGSGLEQDSPEKGWGWGRWAELGPSSNINRVSNVGGVWRIGDSGLEAGRKDFVLFLPVHWGPFSGA